MKILLPFRLPLSCLSVLTLLSVGSARADLLMTQKVEGTGQDVEITTKCKGDQLRIDVAPGMSMIVDTKSGSMTNLMHTQKSYMQIPASVAQAAVDNLKRQQAQAGASPNASEAKPQLTATGNKETISGFAAEEYNTTLNNLKMHLWLTKTMPDYQSALKQLAAATEQGPLAAQSRGMGMNVDLANLPGFPLKTVLEMGPSQKVTSTVTAISTKPIPDSEFIVPAGYQEIKVPNLTPPVTAPPPPPGSPSPGGQ